MVTVYNKIHEFFILPSTKMVSLKIFDGVASSNDDIKMLFNVIIFHEMNVLTHCFHGKGHF